MNNSLAPRYRSTLLKILSANERVERVVLFGSRAMQTNSPESDIDLVLIGKELTFSDKAQLADEIDESTIPQRVDLLLESSLKDEKLRKHIENYGVEWYSKQQN